MEFAIVAGLITVALLFDYINGFHDGATRRMSAVRWGIAGRIVWAWVLPIPASGLIRRQRTRC